MDFGLSQYTQSDKPSLLQTVCGTHKYLSPEMILCDRGRLKGYSRAVDMWGVGIILYVMLFGFNPFEGRTRAETHENILKCKYTYPSDTNASAQVKDLISHLLVRDYTKRFTSQECLAHPYAARAQSASARAAAPPPSARHRAAHRRRALTRAPRRPTARLPRARRAAAGSTRSRPTRPPSRSSRTKSLCANGLQSSTSSARPCTRRSRACTAS